MLQPKQLVQALSLSLLISSASAGAVVNIEGDLYEIETVTGLLGTYRSTIENQVWFGNNSLARIFANEVGTYFGTPNYSLYGPMFAYDIYDGVGADYATGWVYTPARLNLEPSNRSQVNTAAAGNYYTYATGRYIGSYVTTVPEPDTYALMLSGLLVIVGISKQRNGTKNV